MALMNELADSVFLLMASFYCLSRSTRGDCKSETRQANVAFSLAVSHFCPAVKRCLLVKSLSLVHLGLSLVPIVPGVMLYGAQAMVVVRGLWFL